MADDVADVLDESELLEEVEEARFRRLFEFDLPLLAVLLLLLLRS